MNTDIAEYEPGTGAGNLFRVIAFCGVLMFCISTYSYSENRPVPRKQQRISLCNTLEKLNKNKKIKITVVGNSVSKGASLPDGARISWYHGVTEWIKEHFPDAEINLQTKIIYAIGPESQIFWMDEDVISEEPDLVLLEFGAANGAWGNSGRPVTDPATEGYVRRLRLMLPETDCLINIGLFRSMMDAYNFGKTPETSEFLYRVGLHYNCAVADSGAAIAKLVSDGQDWSIYMKDDIHPKPAGYKVHHKVIKAVLDLQLKAFNAEKSGKSTTHVLPRETLTQKPWICPRRVPAFLADAANGFLLEESGKVKYLKAADSAATGTFSIGNGDIVGLFMHHTERGSEGNDNLEIRLDDKDAWARLGNQAGPRFMRDDTPRDLFNRHFFISYSLPLTAKKLSWRVPENYSGDPPCIVAFLVIEKTKLPCSFEREKNLDD